MNDKNSEKELAHQLLSLLDTLVEDWLDYCNQKNITEIETRDMLQSAEACFYGIGVNYINVICIKEAVTIFHIYLNDANNPELYNKLANVDKEFAILSDIYQEIQKDFPDAIKMILYFVNSCYKNKKGLFVDFEYELLNSKIEFAQKLLEKLNLWKQNEKE
jgi:hypothetical protein